MITDTARFLVRMATLVADEYGGAVDDDIRLLPATEEHLRLLGCTETEIGELTQHSEGMTSLDDWREGRCSESIGHLSHSWEDVDRKRYLCDGRPVTS